LAVVPVTANVVYRDKLDPVTKPVHPFIVADTQVKASLHVQLSVSISQDFA